jgi:hypothetical protein
MACGGFPNSEYYEYSDVSYYDDESPYSSEIEIYGPNGTYYCQIGQGGLSGSLECSNDLVDMSGDWYYHENGYGDCITISAALFGETELENYAAYCTYSTCP